MSRAARDPLAADRLSALLAAQAMIHESLPDPPQGRIRDKLADDGAARVDRAVTLMEDVIKAYNDRVAGVVEARLRGPKARKGTRFWSDQVKARGDLYQGRGLDPLNDHRTGLEHKALDATYVLPERTVDEIGPAIRPVGLRIVADAAGGVAKSLGRPNTGLAAFDWSVIETAVDSAVQAMADVAERHARDVRREILSADSSADSLDQVIDRILEAQRRGGNWLLMYGRTLATALAGDAALAAARALGVTHTQWLCVAADTEIWATGALNVARRWSTEGLLRITTDQGSGARGELAVTPDHPLLCQRGWIPARELHSGDYLIRSVFTERAAGSDPDVQSLPAQIGETFAAANELRPAQRVMRAAVDFDSQGDGGYVDVVPIDGELADRLQPSTSEPRAQQLLTLPDLDLEHLLLARARHDMRIRLSSSDVQGGHEGIAPRSDLGTFVGDSVMSGSRFVAPWDVPLFDDALDHLKGSGVSPPNRSRGFAGKISGGDTVLVEDAATPSEGLGRASLGESFRSLSEAAASGVTSREQADGGAQAAPDGFSADIGQGGGDLPRGFPSLIATDQIINIKFDSVPAHVYDLQTGTGWFVANGYIIHNSRRDDRVRETHRVADGQVRPVDGGKFQVGAYRLRFPGDPEVLPGGIGELANCRCSLLWSQPSADKRKALALVKAGTPAAARQLLARRQDGIAEGAPELHAVAVPQVTVPAPVVAYRAVDSEIPVVPGQQLSWPGALALALAPSAAIGAANLAVVIPSGFAVGVAGGAVVLAAGVTLGVLSVSSGQVVAQPVIAPTLAA